MVVPALLFAVLAGPPAGAGPEVDAPSEDRIGARVDGEREGAPAPAPARRRRTSARRTPAAAPVTFVAVPVVRVVEGAACLTVERRRGDPSALVAVTAEARILQLGSRLGRCPASPAGRTAAPASPAEPAVRAWAEQLVLPSPTLRVQPGRAVVGKAAYLEIGGPAAAHWQVDALGWALDIGAVATYTIDWGDGTVDGGVTSQGGPWPGGDLRHAYLAGGDHVIAVTEHWTATWTATGHGQVTGGVLTGVLRTRAALTLPVVELQAVRTR